MINWTRVAELRSDIGADGFDEVVGLFLDEVVGEIERLRAGCPDTDLERKLHFLKGCGLNMGFHQFAALCKQGEAAAKRGDHHLVDLRGALISFDNSRIAFLRGLRQMAAT